MEEATRHNAGLAVEGGTFVGGDYILLEQDDNLIKQTPWADRGYTVERLIAPESYQRLCLGMREIIFGMVRRAGVSVSEDESLLNYHKVIENDDSIHFGIAKWGLPIDLFPIDPDLITHRISEICGVPLRIRATPPDSGVGGLETLFGFRVVRPQSRDHNPMHRDAWQDLWRGSLNIWIPIAGCNEKSSLPLVPGSHLWLESEIERTKEGALVGGRKYNVPSVVGSTRKMEPIVPNPGPNEVLVFSPYLIHGGAGNQNLDMTRVSIEMRFERRV
jgi:hypothetical protein